MVSEDERNMEFSKNTDYLSVKKNLNNSEAVNEAIENNYSISENVNKTILDN